MVCHETYKDENNNWLSPNEVEKINNQTIQKDSGGKKVIVGPSESMSKSKKNVIDPENIIEIYGADAVRLFILSDSPPEKDVQWSDQGMVSSFKFIQKLWTLHNEVKNSIFENKKNREDEELDKFTNQLIAKFTNNLEKFNYNVIIANMYETYNYLIGYIKENKNSINLENYKKILICFSPIIPHFSSECLSEIGAIKNITWPSYDVSKLEEKDINFVIQINGKKRAILNTKKGTTEKILLEYAKKDRNISKYLENKQINKIIFVQDRLINILINE